MGAMNKSLSPGALHMICRQLSWSDTLFWASVHLRSPSLAVVDSSQSWEGPSETWTFVHSQTYGINLPPESHKLPPSILECMCQFRGNHGGAPVLPGFSQRKNSVRKDRWNKSLHFQLFKILHFIVMRYLIIRCAFLLHIHIFPTVSLSARTIQVSATFPA